MEGVDKRPVIIEFNGLPGSGKTTIARALGNTIESMEMSVSYHYYRHNYQMHPKSLLLTPKYIPVVKALSDYVKLLPKGQYMPRILSMVNFLRMYRNFTKDKKSDFLLIDQGIIQSFISLSHQDQLTKSPRLNKAIKSMHLDTLPVLFVNCHVRENISNARIMSRASNGCRVESMTEEIRHRTLKTQEENFSYLREVIKESFASYIDINTDNSVDDSLGIVIERMGITPKKVI